MVDHYHSVVARHSHHLAGELPLRPDVVKRVRAEGQRKGAAPERQMRFRVAAHRNKLRGDDPPGDPELPEIGLGQEDFGAGGNLAERARQMSRSAGQIDGASRETSPVGADGPQYRLTHKICRIGETVDEIRSLVARRKDFDPVTISRRLALRQELFERRPSLVVELKRREKRLLWIIFEQL